MTYFGFLGYFLCIPIALLAVIAWWDERHGRRLPAVLSSWSPYVVIAAMCVVALVYTTPGTTTWSPRGLVVPPGTGHRLRHRLGAH